MATTRSALATAFGLEALVVCATFVIAAVLHLGVPLAGFSEPKIFPATIVEGIIALFFAIATWSVFARGAAGWVALVAAHCVGIAGVVLGIIALALGRGPTTPANYVYHRVILFVLIVGLFLLLAPPGRAAFRAPSPR